MTPLRNSPEVGFILRGCCRDLGKLVRIFRSEVLESLFEAWYYNLILLYALSTCVMPMIVGRITLFMQYRLFTLNLCFSGLPVSVTRASSPSKVLFEANIVLRLHGVVVDCLHSLIPNVRNSNQCSGFWCSHCEYLFHVQSVHNILFKRTS